MRRVTIFTFILAAMLLVACQRGSKFEKVVSTYPNGEKQLVYIMQGDEKKAVKIKELIYYNNGQLQSEKIFTGKDEHPCGVWQYYYPTGEVFASVNYNSGDSKGSDWQFFDRGGKHYLEGQYDSLSITEYSEIGSPATVVFYSDNTQNIYQFYTNCAIRCCGKTVDGKREGRWIFYHPNGLPQTEASYINGLENGRYIVYRESGMPYYQGIYSHGKRCGEWEFYDEEGKIMHTQKF